LAVILDDYGKQIVVVHAPSMDTFDGFKTELGRDLSKYRVVAVGLDPSGSVPRGLIPIPLGEAKVAEAAERVKDVIGWLKS
jgi:hypothetical protein